MPSKADAWKTRRPRRGVMGRRGGKRHSSAWGSGEIFRELRRGKANRLRAERGKKELGECDESCQSRSIDLGSCVERRTTGPRRRCRRPARVRNHRLGHYKPCRWHEKPDGAAYAPSIRPNRQGVPPSDNRTMVSGRSAGRTPTGKPRRSKRRWGSKARPFTTASRCGKRFVP